ncbi:MAG: purine-nucleoside phosphorylase [Deltaproteobacteria bacterium]|nr:purine-nucleoside phosphorylase [Deltaproteobacteria bacterium]
MFQRIQDAAEYISSKIKTRPRVGIITGTGLGKLTTAMTVDQRLSYREIPHFPRSTTKGHKGTLALGSIGETGVVAMEGRFHLYEGYGPEGVVLPVRVMSRLGAKILMISSAAGGLNPVFQPGDLMMVTDHLNLTGTNPLIGPNLEEIGPRFPDMNQAYDRGLMDCARRKSLELQIALKEGVYAGIPGPSLETPAETRFLRAAGADAVGMSTVLEVIAGVHCGMKILVIVAISNVNLPHCTKEISIDEVIANAEKAGEKLAPLFKEIITAV